MSNEIIEFNNGVATIYQKTISRIVPVAEVIKRLEKKMPVTIPSIGRTQVFAHYDETDSRHKKMLILAELNPAVRSITKVQRDRRTRKRYRLSFPWTYFWFTAETSAEDPLSTFRWVISQGQIFFAKERYQDINSPMIIAATPNIDSSGYICWGTTGVSHEQYLGGQIDQRVNEWYNSNFNADLDNHGWVPYGEVNYRRWVEESAKNPNCWQDWEEWTSRRNYTVKELMNTEIVTPEFIAQRFNAEVEIPPVNLPMSFGRWEDYWRMIPVEERNRGLVALQNLVTDEPTFAPVETPVPGADEDGGVIVHE